MSIDTSKVANTNATTPAKASKPNPVGAAAGYLDDRTGLATAMKKQVRKVFPDHWSFMLGEIALWSFVIVLLTGVFLTFWFTPSMGETTYEGSYDQLRGIEMSEAYASSLNISFDVRGGLLMRQMHHWAAMLFIAAMMVHLLRVFFTGAHRKPRELNWVIGCLLLILGTLEGFTGYSLPDDLLSGTGVRATDGFLKASPVVGTYMSFFVFGGEFPGEIVIQRFFTVHVLLIPGLLLALVGAHMVLLVYHKHTQWPGPGRTEQNVVGYPLLPIYAAKAGGFFFIVFGVVALMGALFTINPVWKYGPYDPSKVTAGSQPDWYMGWPDGALRIMPGWETHIFGVTISWNVMLPILILPVVMFMLLMMLPFIEAWITGDKRDHHILQRPRDAPDPDRRHGGVDDHVRAVLGRRRQRHHRDQAAHEHQPHHVLHAGDGLRRTGDRVPHHQALVHLAPAALQRHGAARLRVRHHHAVRRWRVQRAAPADQRGPRLHAHRRGARRGLRPGLGRRRERRPGQARSGWEPRQGASQALRGDVRRQRPEADTRGARGGPAPRRARAQPSRPASTTLLPGTSSTTTRCVPPTRSRSGAVTARRRAPARAAAAVTTTTPTTPTHRSTDPPARPERVVCLATARIAQFSGTRPVRRACYERAEPLAYVAKSSFQSP